MADVSIPDDIAALESVLCTEELRRRPARPPDYQQESRALVALAQALAESPVNILQTLADTILELTAVGSAGISLLTADDGGERFYWPAVSGVWKSYIGGGTPRNFGPCGDVLDHNSTLLFCHPERRYTYLQPITPAVEEALLVPFYVAGKAVGTIWAVSHDPALKFDAEDERLMNTLAVFASSAFQVVNAIESNRRLKLQAHTFDVTLSTITDFAYTFDSKGRFVYVNQALLDLWGLKLEEATGKDFFDLKYPDDLAVRLQSQIQQVFKTKCGLKDETSYTSPTGVIGYYEYIFSPVFDAHGNVEAVVGSTRDISERKRTEEALRDAKTRLVATLYASEIATWTWDVQRDRMVADENMARLFSMNKEAASGASIQMYLTAIHPEDRSRVEAAISEALTVRDKFYEVDYRLVQADGSIRWVTARGRVEHDAEGKALQFPGVLIDITDRKRAEENFRQLNETLEHQVQARTQELQARNAEILQQAGQLRDLSNRLQQSQDNERRRIARELHDSAGQIMVALSMNLASIVQGNPDSHVAEQLERSQELVQELNKEIRTMSYLLHPPLLDEAGLSGAIGWYLDGLKQRSGLKVDLNISQDLHRLSDETELAIFRIVQECLTNIHRHAGADTARVDIARHPEDISIEIHDNGKGMSAEKLTNIQYQRSGVGITGMRERVRLLNGTMNILSDKSGTKVMVSLPITQESNRYVK